LTPAEPSERAISPVVGVTLLVAIVVLLVALTAALVFDLSERREPAPEVNLKLEVADDGVTHRLVHETGDRLDGDKVTLRGAADTGVLSGSDLTAGQKASFIPVNEEVRVVYTGEHGTTYTLWTFEAETTAPEPDEGCSWVEDETNGGTDEITINGIVVNCDVRTDGEIDLENGAVVIGEVVSENDDIDIDRGTVYDTIEAAGDIDAEDATLDGDAVTTTLGSGELDLTDTTLDGDIDTADDDATLDNAAVGGTVNAGGDGDIDLSNGSEVDGGLLTGSDGAVTVENGRVGGRVEAGNSIDFSDTTVGGPVVGETDTDVTVDTGSTVNGDITSGSDADLTITDASTVDGDLATGGSATVDSGSSVEDIDAGSDVTLSSATADGSVTSGEDVTISNTSVSGTVTASGEATVDSGSTVGGIDAGSSVSVDGSTVERTIDGSGDIDVMGGSVEGAVEGDGDVTLDTTSVDGAVYSPGDVDIDGVTVGGDAFVSDGAFSCDASTVDGQPCSSYDSEDPGDY